MRILLDECLPRDFIREFPGHVAQRFLKQDGRALKMEGCFA